MAFQLDTGEFATYRQRMAPHTLRFWKALTFRPMVVNTGSGDRRDGLGHAWMNLYVESARANPYIHGHLQAWADLINVAVVVGIVLVMW